MVELVNGTPMISRIDGPRARPGFSLSTNGDCTASVKVSSVADPLTRWLEFAGEA